MPRAAKYLALTLLVLTVLTAPEAAHAEGFTTITCEHSHFAQVDPLIKWTTMLPPDPSARSGHPHDFVGNTSTDSNSTTASLLAGGTTCNVKSDVNAIWFPAGTDVTGQPVPGRSVYRLIKQSTAQQPATVPPNGLGFIHGDAENASATAIKPMYNCRAATGPPTTAGTTTIPASCPAGTVKIEATFYNGSGCWNGVDMGPGLGRGGGPANGRDHMLNVGPPSNPDNLDCTNGVTVPRVSTILEWPASPQPQAGSMTGGHVSSDDHDGDGLADVPPGVSLHVDFVYLSGKDGQGRDFYQRVVDMCLNQPTVNDGVCQVKNGELIRNKDKAVVLDAGRTMPAAAEVPASAVPLDAYDVSVDGTHYYTNVVGGTYPAKYQPIPSPARLERAADNPTACVAPMRNLRRYSKNGDYTYTDDAAERQTLLAGGWVDQLSAQGLACTVPGGTAASVPLYRLDMPDGDHVLTVSAGERDVLVGEGGVVRQLGNAYPPVGD